MSKPFIDFGAVKAAVSFQQVLDHYGFTAQMRSIRNGDGLEGPCPIHEGTSQDIFKVTLSKNCWFCHNSACKCGGNHLDFVAKMEKVDAHEAALRLDQWFNLGLAGKSDRTPQRDDAAPSTSAPSQQLRNSPTSAGTSTVARPEDPLEEPGDNKPLNFKLDKLKDDHPYLAERGLSIETIAEFGVGYCAKGTMSGRVVIPIHNANGELVGYAGRWPGEPPVDRPKYKLPKDFKKSAEVFSLHRAMQMCPDDEPLIIVEGFFDVMKVWQAGYRRVAALMGSHLSRQQEELIHSAVPPGRKCVVWLDNDETGRKGAQDCVVRLSRNAFVRNVVLDVEGAQPEHLSPSEIQALVG